MYLSLSSEFNGARMQLSSDLDFENVSTSIEHVAGHHSTSKLITLTKNEINEYCKFDENSEQCTIYLKLYTSNDFET